MTAIEAGERQQTETIFFGLGYMQFIPRSLGPEGLTGTQYFRFLEADLLSIPFVSNINIGDASTDTSKAIIKEALPLSESLFALPQAQISFNINIPYRLQKEVDYRPTRRTNTENFRVSLRYGYSSPVAIVQAIEARGTSDGSDCIFIVRKFLEQCMSESPSCRFRLDILGPAPFHADFEIRALKRAHNASYDSAYEIQSSIKKQPGYDLVVWEVLYKDPSLPEAVDAIHDDLYIEVDFYYEIKQNAHMLHSSWEEARAAADKAIEINGKRGFPLSTGKHRAVTEAIIEIIHFHVIDISVRSQLRKELDEHKITDYGILSEYSKPEVNRLENFAISPLRDLLQFIEGRHRHIDNKMVALFASVAGGLVGGALALVAAWLWP